ncbi:MAG: thioredoxin-dependent thiol peroxidase [Pseudomonadota bacterium]
MPEVGEKAPEFTLPSTSGTDKSLSDYAGKTLILFFYPKDNTSGCTKEAVGFSEKLSEFEAAGAAVVGVSKDSMKSHHKFIEKHDLKVELLSDEESSLCEDFDVWKQKSMYGKTYMGIERSTFVIDGSGVITHAWRKVKVPGHVDAVLEAVTNG